MWPASDPTTSLFPHSPHSTFRPLSLPRKSLSIRARYVGRFRQKGPNLARNEDHDLRLCCVGLEAHAIEEAVQEVYGRLESLGVVGGDDAVIRIEDGDESADFAERDGLDNEKVLPLADNGAHHQVEDGGKDGAALGDAAASLEGEPKTPGGLTASSPSSWYSTRRIDSSPLVATSRLPTERGRLNGWWIRPCGTARRHHAPRDRRPERQLGRSTKPTRGGSGAGHGGAWPGVRVAPLPGASRPAPAGEVDVEAGEGERHPAGRAPMEPQPTGLHPHPGGGAEAGQELPMDLPPPPSLRPSRHGRADVGQARAQAVRTEAGDPPRPTSGGRGAVGGGGDVHRARGHHREAAEARVGGERVDPPRHLGGRR